MAHAQTLIALKVVFINKDNQVLALEAHTGGPMSGYYDLPGGRIDEGEVGKPFIHILGRELSEELGDIKYVISAEPLHALSWIWPDGTPVTFIYYQGELASEAIKISEEHLSYQWVNLTQPEINKYFTTYHHAALSNYLINKQND